MKSWAEMGISLPVGATGNIKIPCPMCGGQRRGKTDFSLNVEEGVAHCFKCSHVISLKGGGGASKAYKRPDPIAVTSQAQPLYAWFKARGIGRDVVDRNEIVLTEAWMRQGEPKMTCIVVPFMRGEQVVNRYYRALEDKGIVRLEKDAERLFFKLNDLNTECTILTEGPWDALACEQAGMPNAMSVPNGAPPANSKNMDGYFSFLAASEEALLPVKKFVLAMDNDEPGKHLEHELARRLGFHRCAKVEWPEGSKDANDVLLKYGGDILRAIIEQATPYPIEGVYSFSSMKEGVLRLYDHGVPRGCSTGWSILDPYYTVLPGQVTIVHGVPNHGKALGLDTPVPTANGWAVMGDIKAGDRLFDEQGKPCEVLRVSEIMHGRECYRVSFSDGTSIVADADHQWLTRTDAARRSAYWAKNRRRSTDPRAIVRDQTWKRTYPKVVTTREISESLLTRAGKRPNHAIQVASPLDLMVEDLPIPPYILGLWLGDGDSDCARLTMGQHDLDSIRLHISASGYKIGAQQKSHGASRVTISPDVPRKGRDGGPGSMMRYLRRLNLIKNKHLPPSYLRAAEHQRLALLQGLMDTDGHATANRGCEFSASNKTLAEQTYELVTSLGLVARLTEGKAMLNGRVIGPHYRVTFTPHIQVFRMPRKAARLKIADFPRPRLTHRRIVNVEPIPSEPVRCIQVNSESSLFLVTRAFIPTHNSPFVENLMFNLIESMGWVFGLCSMEHRPLERHAIRLIEKWERAPAFEGPQVDLFRITREKIIEAVDFLDKHVSFIAGPRRMTMEWVLEKAQSLVFRKGIRGLVIDPWNRLEQQRPQGMTEHDYAGDCLDALCNFAQRNAVAVWLVAHPVKLEPHRDRVTGKETQPVPNPYKIAGSSHFYNMPDNILCVWRDITGKEKASHLTEIHVQKVKDEYVGMAGKGKTLAFDRRTGTFSVPDTEIPQSRRLAAG